MQKDNIGLPHWRLKNRVWLALLFISSISVVAMAYAILTVSESIEYDVLEQSVEDEFVFLNNLLTNHPEADLPHTDHFKAWLDKDNHVYAPTPIHNLPLGETHDFVWLDKHWHIERRETDMGVITVAIDISQIEATEALLAKTTIGFSVLILLINLLLARLLSRRLARPIHELSRAITALIPGQKTALSNQVKGAELTEIAEAVDQYQSALIEHIERERLFTAAASHELRTPLAVIHSSLELLQQQLSTHSNHPALQRAIGASNGLQDLVMSLLFLARSQSPQAAHTEQVALHQMLGELLDQYQPELQRNNITLDYLGSEPKAQLNPCHVMATPAHVRIVLSNLIKNAIQAMQASESTSHTLRVTLKLAINNSHCTITFIDTGTGLLTRDFKTLLAAYVSVGPHASTHKHGLGLYISQQICQRYGWTMNGHSLPDGAGSKVSIICPLVLSH